MATPANIRCPACQGPLVPTELHCLACDLAISGRFVTNEFASLGEEDLHFLRIFVLTEGRIRDMESALGVSYPTIKARLAKLKAALASSPSPTTTTPAAPTTPASAANNPASPKLAESEAASPLVLATLKDLEAGRLTFEQAMNRLKELGGTP